MARQHEYACTVCGRPFTRRWTTIRHINKKHDGTGHAETMMGYIVGAIQSRYSFPSYARPRGFPPLKKVKAQDYTDSFIHRWAEMARDSAAIVNHSREYRMLLSNPSFFGTMVNPFARADRIVGRVCKKCHFYDAIIVDKEGTRTSTKHQCEQKIAANVQSLNEEAKTSRLQNIYQNLLPTHIKSIVDNWIGGQKYISAVALDPSITVKSTISLDSSDESHYVIQAVKASKERRVAVPITDDQVMDLIKKRVATYAVFAVDGAAYQGTYLVKILPPPQSQDDDFSKFMQNLFDKYMQRELKIMQEQVQREEQELEVEEAEAKECEVAAQEEARNAVPTDDVAMHPRSGSDGTSHQRPVHPPVHSGPPETNREGEGNSPSNQDQPTA